MKLVSINFTVQYGTTHSPPILPAYRRMAALCGNITPSTARVGSCSKGSSAAHAATAAADHTAHNTRGRKVRGTRKEEGKKRGGIREKPQKKTLQLGLAVVPTCRRVAVHISSFGDCSLHSLHATTMIVLTSVLLPGLLLGQQQSQLLRTLFAMVHNAQRYSSSGCSRYFKYVRCESGQ